MPISATFPSAPCRNGFDVEDKPGSEAASDLVDLRVDAPLAVAKIARSSGGSIVSSGWFWLLQSHGLKQDRLASAASSILYHPRFFAPVNQGMPDAQNKPRSEVNKRSWSRL